MLGEYFFSRRIYLVKASVSIIIIIAAAAQGNNINPANETPQNKYSESRMQNSSLFEVMLRRVLIMQIYETIRETIPSGALELSAIVVTLHDAKKNEGKK